MSDQSRRGEARPPQTLQLRVAFDSAEAFVERQGAFLTGDAMFVRTRDPRPLGTRLGVEVRLRTGDTLLAGDGVVRHTVASDGRSDAVAGMVLQFPEPLSHGGDVLRGVDERRRAGLLPAPLAALDPASWPSADDVPLAIEEDIDLGPDLLPPPTLAPAVVSRPVEAPAAVRRPSSLLAPVVGLELGWSSIRMAVPAHGEVRVVELSAEGDAWPVLAAVSDGRLVTGDEARQAARRGAASVRGITQWIGRRPGAVAPRVWRERRLGDPVATLSGRAGVVLQGEPVEDRVLLHALLTRLAQVADERLGASLSRAVVAVPAGLLASQREMLRQTAAQVGLHIEQFVPSVYAAAVSAGAALEGRRALVVDFADGAFEAAVVEATGDGARLSSLAFDPDTGGAELDEALVELLRAGFEKDTGLPLPDEPGVFERVRQAARDAVAALGEELEHEVVVPNAALAGLATAELRARLPRARLAALSAPLLDRAMESVRRALIDRGLGPVDLTGVLLAGERARLAPLMHRLSERLSRDPRPHPMGASAAAVGAAMLGPDGPTPIRSLQMPAASSLWVGESAQSLRRLIDRTELLPVERVHTALTAADHQRFIDVHVLQGNAERAADNEYLGAAVLGPLPAARRGEVRVALSVGLDANGELTLSARDASTGREVGCRWDPRRGPESLLRPA